MTITRPETGATALALTDDQASFTETQRAALVHIGVDGAGEGDLEVFFHVCKRSGLDPFARQIYMIGRNVRELGPDGNWHTVVKQTIQTGIDGFRLIGRRAADRSHHAVAVEACEWAHEDGSWRPVWRAVWGVPVAARVTIRRDGEPFTATALFDEYAQTKRDGGLTQMWAQRPAGQIAKCAEALAWRMAFPQDLSGIYADEEMGQADNPERVAAVQTRSIDEDLEAAPPEEPSPPLNTSGALARRMYAGIREAGIGEAERLTFVAEVIGREVASTKEMTEAEAQAVLDHLPSVPVDAEVVEDEDAGAES